MTVTLKHDLERQWKGKQNFLMSRIFNNTTYLSTLNGNVSGLKWNIYIGGSDVWPGELKKNWKIGHKKKLRCMRMYVWEWAPCLKRFTSHVNSIQRAPTIGETLNNQVEKLGWPVDIKQYCHQPPLNWHDGSLNREATTKNMKTMHGLPLTNASECLIFSNRAWKHTFNMALFLKETD